MRRLQAYDVMFQTRSSATTSALAQLSKQAAHPQASIGYKRAFKLLEIMSTFLIRYPDSAKAYPHVSSAPYSCFNWQAFRQRVTNAK